MEWLAENWILILLGGTMVAMHLFGHGHGSGHKKGQADTRAAGCCGGHGGEPENENEPGGNDEPRWVAPKESVDLVCGKALSTDVSKPSVHDGQVYYFCSQQCRGTFESTPQEFTARDKVARGAA
jgi:YHS domain-containing protein